MDSLEQSYYEWDGFWGAEHYTTGETAKRIAATAAMIPSDARSLVDVGCGTGEFARQVLRVRPELQVHCIDRSNAALKRVTTEKSVGSVDAIPLANRSKDVVSCLQVLEHLPLPIYRKALDELARVADKFLLISVPFEEDLAENSTKCPTCGSVFNADLHLRSYSQQDVATLFNEQGFQLRKHQNLGIREEVLGMATYERIRSVVAPRARSFLAPSCPICGYRRPAANDSTASVNAPTGSRLRSAFQAAKHGVVARLPRRRLADYWIIALYERRA